MGNKANPKVLRLGISSDWDCSWYAEKNYANNLFNDFNIRQKIAVDFQRAGLTRTVIKRKTGYTNIEIHVARPGVVFGKSGIDIELIKKLMEVTQFWRTPWDQHRSLDFLLL